MNLWNPWNCVHKPLLHSLGVQTISLHWIN